MRPREDTQIQVSLSPRQRWLSRSRIQILIHGLVSQLLVISLISQSHVPVVFQKHQISPEFCWIWFLFGVRYPWTTWLSLFLSIACIPLISIACFYTSSNSCPFLKLSAIFLPKLGHRPSCLNTSMFSSRLVVVQLLSFLRWTHDARDLWPRAVDPLFSSSRYRELIFPSDLISCPPWPLPLTEVTPCCLPRSKSCFLKTSGKPILSPFATLMSLSLLIP